MYYLWLWHSNISLLHLNMCLCSVWLADLMHHLLASICKYRSETLSKTLIWKRKSLLCRGIKRPTQSHWPCKPQDTTQWFPPIRGAFSCYQQVCRKPENPETYLLPPFLFFSCQTSLTTCSHKMLLTTKRLLSRNKWFTTLGWERKNIIWKF